MQRTYHIEHKSLKRYFKLGALLLLYTTLIYQLTAYDHFPLSKNYQFPATKIFIAYIVSLLLAIFLEWRFLFIFKKHVAKKGIILFLKTCLLSTLLVFIVTYSILGNGQWHIYYIIISLLLTLISTVCWIGIFYGKDLILKWTRLSDPDSIAIKSGQTMYKVNFDDLSHFSSTNKVVVAHLKSGRQIVTNFNLTELENLLPSQFFRINRQFILSRETVDAVKSIENQKLEVQLKNLIPEDSLVVSRYRASEFRKWIA